MFKTFKISFRLKSTYFVNGFIYSLRQLPLVGKHLSGRLYQSKLLKIIGYIFNVIKELLSIFLWKFVYFSLILVPCASMMGGSKANNFLTLFFFFSIIGAFLNTSLFNPSRDKYYAMFLLRMDAKKYVLTDYTYFLITQFVGLLPFAFIFGLPLGLSFGYCLLLPLLVIAIKNNMNAFHLYQFATKQVLKNENKLQVVAIIGVLASAALAFLLPYFNFALNPVLFTILVVSIFIVNIKAFLYLFQYQNYYYSYKSLFSNANMITNNQSTSMVQQNLSLARIEMTEDSSNKVGYAYFNDLFTRRHRKILTKATKKICYVILAIFLMLLLVIFINPALRKNVNQVILMYVPYFLIIMYAINRGQPITQAMFMNCDHSMLAYNFYRQPKAILDLFRERLKTLILINLQPALLIGSALAVLLAVSGGTEQPIHYIILIITIVAMSVFFSVHHLVIYYLLQPYNVNLEMKSSTYTIVNSLTYLVCYYTFQLKVPILIYGLVVLVFTVLYSMIALYLAYTRAPKTFKLRP